MSDFGDWDIFRTLSISATQFGNAAFGFTSNVPTMGCLEIDRVF